MAPAPDPRRDAVTLATVLEEWDGP